MDYDVKVKIGMVQVSPGEDFKKTLDAALDLIRECAKEGAGIVCFPEAWLHVNPYKHLKELTSSFNYVLDSMSSLAKSLRITIVVGGIYEERDDRYYITCPVISHKGNVVGKQDKVHPFMGERRMFARGNGYTIFDLKGIKFGITICHDVAYPESARVLAVAGADMMFNPSRIARQGIGPWRLYLMARSLENRMVSVGVNVNMPTHPGGSSVIVPKEMSGNVFYPAIVKEMDDNLSYSAIEVNIQPLRKAREERLSNRVPESYKIAGIIES